MDWIEPKALISPDKQRALVDYIVKNDLLYLKDDADQVDDTPGGTDGSLYPISSNAYYDHVHASDPHGGSITTITTPAPSDLSIDCGSQKTLVLTTPTYDDLLVPVTATKLGGSKDPGFSLFKDNGSSSQGVFIYWFDASSEEELYFAAQFPHTMKVGTAIYPHVHWVPAVTADGNPANQAVRWGLEYTWADIGQSFGNSTIIYISSRYPNDANVVAGKHYISSFTSIAATASAGQGVSSVLVCRIFREAADGADNYEHDAGLLAIDFHHQVDTMGSRQELTK